MILQINKMFRIIQVIRLLKIFFYNFYVNKTVQKYINFNQIRWQSEKVNRKSKKDVILIDLFDWGPWIHFWSYVVNFLSKGFKSDIKYYYFDLYGKFYGNKNYYIRKIRKIFHSFNANKGILESDLVVSKQVETLIKKKFDSLKFSKAKLINLNFEGINIGTLIYDTYLRSKYTPTVDMHDEYLRMIFRKAFVIHLNLKKYFNENNVRCVIPSHLCYITYGIIVKMAHNRNIPVIMINSKNAGTNLFYLIKVNKKINVCENEYWKYSSIFQKFNEHKKKESLIKGKEILNKRISGQFDSNIPYMRVNQFSKKISKVKNKISKKRGKIFLFPHCYFDNPHRYRWMIFSDFYEQTKYFLDLSNKMTEYDWFYKPHPNELKAKIDLHKELLKDYPHVTLLDNNMGHRDVINSKPTCVITNHGTIAHEFAAFKIPVINTGDNPHTNYDFCINAKNIKNLDNIMKNLDKFTKKINFNKNKLYEFYYLHYEHFLQLNKRKELISDEYFSSPKLKVRKNMRIKGVTEIFLNHYLKVGRKNDKKIETYLRIFSKKNRLFN